MRGIILYICKYTHLYLLVPLGFSSHVCFHKIKENSLKKRLDIKKSKQSFHHPPSQGQEETHIIFGVKRGK